MGDIARQNRCNRFIKEFADDCLIRFDLTSPATNSQYLGEYNGGVFVFANMQTTSGEQELMLPLELFNADVNHKNAVEQVSEALGMDLDEVGDRFKKAKL